MSIINGSADVEPEVISIPSDDILELEPTEELEGEEMKVLQPTELNSEYEHPIYRAAASPPPSPSSDISSVEPHSPRDLCEVDLGEFVPSRVLMVCSHCFVYALVSTANQKCPKCGSYDLFDVLKLLPVRV